MPIRLWFVFWGIYVLTFELWLRNSKFRWKNKWRRSGYWLDSIRRGLHWSETRIFVGLHWIGRLRLPLGKKLNWIAFCELRRVPHLRCFERLDCLGWVDITWIALDVDCIGLKVLYFCWIALDCVREWKAGRWISIGLQLSWIGLDWKLGVALLVGFVHERKFESLKCQPRPGDSFFWKCSKVRPLRRPCVTQNFAFVFFKVVYFSSTALDCVK